MDDRPTRRQSLLAIGALAGVAGSIALVITASAVSGVPVLLLTGGAVVVTVVGLWLVVAHRRTLRVAGMVLAAAAVVAVVGIEAANHTLWALVGSTLLFAAGMAAAQAAVGPPAGPAPPTELRTPPPRRPFVIMNPRSGGGKVERFGLLAKAEEYGAEVALIDAAGTDVAALARKAVADGADLLGVAAGDGTQAEVAGVAAAAGVPLLVIPAGTRNHFAYDLGLDRDDPAAALTAIPDGVELEVDLGDVNGRPFVNNVSFGAYAAAVARPDYRDDKVRTTLDVLPDLLTGPDGPHLVVTAGEHVVQDPTVALVSNNPYGTGDVAGMSRRARLDAGVLGLATARVSNAWQAAGLLRGRHGDAVSEAQATVVMVESDAEQVPAGIDGESVLLRTPVTCRVRPKALRVRVPRDRPAVPVSREPFSVRRLLALAVRSSKEAGG